MAVNLSPVGGVAAQFFTNTGAVLTGGKLYTYLAGTTTPATTYTTSAGNVAWANPVVLDAAGRVPSSGEIWLTDGVSYKFLLKDSNDVLIATYDNIRGINSVDAEDVIYTPLGTGAVATSVENKLNQYVSAFDFMTAQQIADVQAGTAAIDVTDGVQRAISSGVGAVYFPAGVYKITSEVTLVSNLLMYGDGQGKTTLLFYKASNPVTSQFMLAARRLQNILIEKMTIKSNAFADGLFNVGTYNAGPPKTYTGTYNGNINGFLISSCSNVTVQDCEITGFNYDGIRVSVEGGVVATDYNYNLTFDNIYGHHCLVTPIDILGTRNFKVVNSTLTDNGNFTANYIDGGAGYGVALGRSPAITQLRSFGGLCANNFCARNARHGIDVHAGGNIVIQGNVIEDNLLQGISVQDNSGSADDTFVGDVTVADNSIYHTDWVESRYPLITWVDSVTERDDSCPIFVSQVGAGLLQNAIVTGNSVRSWRFRQLVNNVAGTDLIGFLAVWVVNNTVIANNSFEQTNVSYLPSFGFDVTAVKAEFSANSWVAKQRSTVSKSFFIFNITGDATVSGNHFELQNIYSDQGTTQVAYPMFKDGTGEIAFTGNTIVQSSQGTRGSLWYTTSTDQRWGFNGILSSNVGNMLKVAGSTWMEYASRIKGSLSIYASNAGAGRYDGFSSGNAFLIGANTTQLENVLADMPFCESGLTFYVLDQVDFGLTSPITIPVWQDNIRFGGNSADNTNSMTKTAGFTTTGAGLYFFKCPDNSRNIDFEYLYFKSASIAGIVYKARNVNYSAFEPTNAAASGVIFSQQSGFCRTNRFKGGYAAITAERASAIVSQLNDSDATQPTYGLVSDSSAIYKNSTQPTGSTANTLTQNGGTIA
jgi:hypothetical protein